MNKFLRYSFVVLMAIILGKVSAQEVTFDFTLETEEGSKTSVWGFPAGSKNKVAEEKSFTYGGYTIKVAGSEGEGYYWHDKDHYLLFGKQGATLTLPKFDFDVERIDIEGTSGASTGIKQNIFVGDEAVSTETKGAQNVTNEFLIAEGKQSAGTIYIIKVTSNHNNQIKTIKVWKKGTISGQTSDEVKKVTVADFNAAAESNDVWYQLTGIVKNLKDGDIYGNFDLEDETGSVYVYGLLSEKGGDKKKFQELAAAKGIKNGCKLTIIGTRGSYNGKIEVMNAYFVSVEPGSDTPEPQPSDEVKKVTVADFNAAAESNDVWYQLTGIVKNLKDDDIYGNFDLEDETGSVYVYGVLSEKGGEKKKFQELAAAKGIKNGCKLTIIGTRGSYNGKIEVMNAYFVSVEPGSDNPEPQPSDEVKEVTVAKALEIISALENGKTTSEEYLVKGFVVGTPDFQRKADGSLYGNVNFTIADEKGGATTVTIFRAKNIDNVNFTEETISSLNEGDEVVVRGKLQKYVKNGEVTPEVTNCYLISVISGASGIQAVKTVKADNGFIYNLAGQRVDANYKGVVIKNGQKMIQK